MIERLHIIVALFAALAVTILSLFQDTTFYVLSVRLVIIIPIFYMLGLFFRSYFTKLFLPPIIHMPEHLDDKPADEDKMAEEDTDTGVNDSDMYDLDEDYNDI